LTPAPPPGGRVGGGGAAGPRQRSDAIVGATRRAALVTLARYRRRVCRHVRAVAAAGAPDARLLSASCWTRALTPDESGLAQ
jgi:hypothetical protein